MLQDSINNTMSQDSDYNFADGDLSQFTNVFKADKQDLGVSEEVTDREAQGILNEDDFSDNDSDTSEEKPVLARESRTMAKGLIIGGDEVLSSVLGMFNSGDNTPFKLDPDEKDQLTESLSLILRYNNAKISPTWGFVILVIAIYGGKTNTLIQLRKERKEKQLLQDKIIELDKRLNNGTENKGGNVNDSAGV